LLSTNANELISCVSLSPATILSVPIYDFAEANEELSKWLRMDNIHAAESIFVAGACTPSVSLVTIISVRFAILTELT
jgi:hypothetical protein